jgi:hypothetical protein
MAFNSIIGSRAEVWHGSAKKTSGGLTKSHLMKNKSGRIVSRKKHFSAKKDNRLVKAGFKTKKGHFGFIKSGSKKHGHGKKMRGGMVHNISSPADLSKDLQSLGSNSVQFRAGMTGGSAYGNEFNPADVNASDITGYMSRNSTNVQMRAGQAGGKRHRRSHKMRGGTSKGMMGRIEGSPLDAALTH